ncbi:MAG: hypothetical protein AAB599_03525 [Patescibacteria group bacterium]
MLTQEDLGEIEQLIDEKVVEKIKLLPTKDEFFEKMDQVMGELQAIRDEHTMRDGRIDDHEERIENLEKIHPQDTHAAR